MKNVGVIYGGVSIEHDVSVITGVLTANSLDKEYYNAVLIYIDGDGNWFTGDINDLDLYKNLDVKKLKRVTLINGDNTLYEIKGKKLKPVTKIDVVINCLHGERGEDGSLAGLLNMSFIPLASSGLGPSSVAIDKHLTKLVLKGLKVPAFESVTVSKLTDMDSIELPFEFPVICKPVCGGSSIGIKKAKDRLSLFSALSFAFRYSDQVIIEPCITDFTEINCACFKDDKNNFIVSECEKPVGKTETLSFADKYESGNREFPAKLERNVSEKIKAVTKKIYNNLGFSGVIRIDFFVKNGKLYVNEINSVPGSLAYYLFCDTLKEFSEMLDKIIKKSLSDFAKKSTIVKVYKSNILSAGGAKSAKRGNNK